MKIRPTLFLLLAALFSFTCGEIETTVDAPAQIDDQRPIYGEYARILHDYVVPGRGVEYAKLKENDAGTLQRLREEFGKVDPSSLGTNERLAYWINVYNLNVLGTVVEHYPIDSIREISTDPVRRLNVFEQPLVPAQGELISLDTVEHERIRGQFDEPRIHFAVNCAAESCPPIRPEPFTADDLDRQLTEQTRRFLNGPNGVELEDRGDHLAMRTTKIMDWFREDFVKAGGIVEFVMDYAEQSIQTRLATAEDVRIEFQDYSWELNDVDG